MRGRILKRIALVVLVSFFCTTFWASTSWAWYVGGQGPGEYKMTTRSEMGGNKLAAYVVTTVALILGGKYVIDRFGGSKGEAGTFVILPHEAMQFFKPKSTPKGTPEDSAYRYYSRDNFVPSVTLCSDAIVPGTYEIPEAQTTKHQPWIEGEVDVKEALAELQESGLLVSWCAVENKQQQRHAEFWIDEATPIAQYLKLEPGQTLGVHLTPTEGKTEKHTIRVKTFTKTYFGEEDVKTYKGEIGRDAKMHSQWYGCYLELKKDDYKFKK